MTKGIRTPEEVLKDIDESDTYSKGVRDKRRDVEGRLTKLQKRFAFEVVQSMGASTKSAAQCYVDAGGTPNSARVQASKLMNNVDVQEYINVLMNEMIKATSLDYDEVVVNAREIMEMSRAKGNIKLMLDTNKHLAELLKIKYSVDEFKKLSSQLKEVKSSEVITVSEVTKFDGKEDKINRVSSILQGISSNAEKSKK